MEIDNQRQNLGQAFLTTIWIFQLVVAGPIFVWLGLAAIFNLFYTFDRAYDFITHLCTSLFAAGIFFIVLVQRKLGNTADKTLTLKLEIAKSVFATALWIWLLLDAIFGPGDHFDGHRQPRITAAAVSSILLFIMFYPAVIFVVRKGKMTAANVDLEEPEESGESAPLLRESRSESR